MIDVCGTTTPPPPPPDSPTMHGDLVITELMIDPAGVLDTTGEWIEIYNPTATDFDLTGITFHVLGYFGGGESEFDITGPLTIASNSFAVIGKSFDAVENDGAPIDYVGDFQLPNDLGFALEIMNGTTLIDGIDFAGYGAVTGMSIALFGTYSAEDNDDFGYWCLSVDGYGTSSLNHGSPGAPNTNCL